MASTHRITLDPAAPDSLYAGAQKVNAALDEAEARLERLEKLEQEWNVKIGNALCLQWMEV
ncbi:hypothetical protein FE782_12635 [Paenibacillus antri]|uniref:Uncharacterized protein n=1 Tax=Paenibacillus antri TaxID=2582848 RepID=A0A5R9G5V5_9BACL|nr:MULTISPECIES: hypothetical protein [Paenibacillus]TLS51757.1 hypothetical protein FE782_12635 [Paenibacillus antri]